MSIRPIAPACLIGVAWLLIAAAVVGVAVLALAPLDVGVEVMDAGWDESTLPFVEINVQQLLLFSWLFIVDATAASC